VPANPPRPVIAAAQRRHHAAQASRFYGTIVFRGATFENVAITRRPGELRTAEGGLVDQSELSVRIAKHRISLAPKPRETLTFGGALWQIDTVAGDLAWEQEWVLKISKP